MKYLTTILLLVSLSVNATRYYVSNAGGDANNGLTTSTSWQTISKVNTFSFSSGDSVLFKAGDTWNEKLTIPASNLYFGAYGTGNNPLITGFQTQTGFTQNGNIWSKTLSANSLYTILLNGKLAIKGRTPNTGYLPLVTAGGGNSVTVQPTGGFNYVGKEFVGRCAAYLLDVTSVSAQSGDQLTLNPSMEESPSGGANGYWFQNDSIWVDTVNEYSFNSHKLDLYSASTPTVQTSNIDTLVYFNNKSNIVFDGIAFTGANKYAFVGTSNYSTITNCSIKYCGFGWYADSLKDVIVSNDSIQYCNSMGLSFGTTLRKAIGIRVLNNYFHNNGVLGGMTFNYNGQLEDCLIYGDSAYIAGNKQDSTGYSVFQIVGKEDTVRYNTGSAWCLTKSDGAFVYTFCGGCYWNIPADSLSQQNTYIGENYMSSGVGETKGGGFPAIAVGVYPDNYSNRITIKNNTIQNCSYGDIFTHLANQIDVSHNTLIDSLNNNFRNENSTAITLDSNIFYQKKSTTDVVFSNNTSLIPNANFYLRPTAPTNLIHIISTFYNYNTWTDGSAGTMPASITSSVGTLYSNPTNIDSTLTLPITYTDVRGNIYFSFSVQGSHTSFIGFPYTHSFTKSKSFLIPH